MANVTCAIFGVEMGPGFCSGAPAIGWCPTKANGPSLALTLECFAKSMGTRPRITS